MPDTMNVIDNPIVNDKIAMAKAKKEAEKFRKEAEKAQKKHDDATYKAKLKEAEKLFEEEKKWQQQLLADKAIAETKLNDEIRAKNEASWANLGNKVGENMAGKVGSALNSGLSDLKSNLENIMSSWIDKQESIAYNLNGSYTNATKISEKLTKAINGTGIVKQQEVYEKLSTLVESGIVYNVEQRAYLATLADDLGMEFEATNKSLNRLIRLQSNDLSDNIMAIEANLKTFLNQNYQTSEYIQDGFYNVSESLMEAQSLMSAGGAMELEEVIQQWMGSLYSVGMSYNTITAISQALGDLGSGNINSLAGSNLGRLLNMGASVAGLSYSDLLNNGLTQDSANKLMNGIVSYLSDINSNSTNVVKSSLAEIFGVSVSDIVAASNLNVSPTSSGIISDNIGTLLNKTDSYIYVTQKIENILENFMYSWGTSVASSKSEYLAYKIADTIGSVLGATLDGVTASIKLFGSGVDIDLGKVLSNTGLLATLGGLAGSVGSAFSNLWNGNTGAASIYNALGGSGDTIKTAGNLFGGLDTGISSSANINSKYGVNMDSEAAAAGAVTSATTTTKNITADEVDSASQWQEDIKDSLESLLDEVKAIPLNPFNTYTRITEAENTVTIGNDMTSAYDIMADSAASLRNIYTLLSAYMTGNSGVPTRTVTSDEILSEFGNGLMTNGYNVNAG